MLARRNAIHKPSRLRDKCVMKSKSEQDYARDATKVASHLCPDGQAAGLAEQDHVTVARLKDA